MKKSGIKYETLKKGNYDVQINKIINKYFPKSKVYNGCYSDFSEDEQYLFFRGQSNYRWRLSPNINRDNYDESVILQKHLKEHPQIKNDKLIAHAQHYSKKTRSLDFTSDFKVALYFACSDNVDTDGALYITSYVPHTKNYISALTVNLISLDSRKKLSDKDLANFLISNDEYRELYCKNNNELDTKYICADYSKYLNSGFMLIYDFANEEENIRMKKQKGALFYCGSKYYKNKNQIKDIIPVTTNFPQYDIYLHKINNPTWLDSMYVKVRIPKNIKNDVMQFINMKKEDLGF